MRCVVQRVREARVRVEGRTTASLGTGLVVFVGLARGDGGGDLDWLVGKVARLRVFDDPDGRMNLSVDQVGGGLCVVSQFTLLGDCRRGNRPSYVEAMPVEEARAFWPRVEAAFRATGIPCVFGEFQAQMAVELVNDGPVTLVLDSRSRQGVEG
ncbi:MAG TPA: D-aminoacyl-tRNA deacylase [Myxococcota bacterium]|nr:D-aminoacyl-tRNA deacylase [Myxococcota bacterium]HQK49800.1 D-aminoacyl-tRNA deacylase [Myxococcota bacterium]